MRLITLKQGSLGSGRGWLGAVALVCLAPAHAVSFNIGEIEGKLDSSLTFGTSWALRNPDKNFVGIGNGGRGDSRTADDGAAQLSQGRGLFPSLQRRA